jgi:hypothetical protein
MFSLFTVALISIGCYYGVMGFRLIAILFCGLILSVVEFFSGKKYVARLERRISRWL